MLPTLSMLFETPTWHLVSSTDIGLSHDMLGLLGFLTTCSNAVPCVILQAFRVPIDWSAAPRFLGLLSFSTVLAPDWTSVAASARVTTLTPDWAGGHVSFTVLTPDWASAVACCRATTVAPDWAGGCVIVVSVDAVSV